ncbi:MAG: RNA 3'-terminal phosphate cyclase [Blastocatellia bacterium]|nr:RNA 3'-terminal phosphate cyclase [Blastocatellia bacterium]
MLTIDGSFGEGGGQILRTALGLSLITGTPFKIEKIRAKRSKPGLMRQHLTAVNAAAKVGAADVEGAAIGSQTLIFTPQNLLPGEYSFAVATAGSATLVLQTVLPALLSASASSKLTLEGGTHNPFAPPFDFLAKSFLPLINRMGPKITASLIRPGFYPAGGGRFVVEIEPVKSLSGFDLLQRGEIIAKRAKAMVASLPTIIAEKELKVIAHKMSWDSSCLHIEKIANSAGPGNIVTIELESENICEVFTGFGERGVKSEDVAEQVVKMARRYLVSGVPVGEYLTDQLLVPLAIAGEGSFVSIGLSRHSTTNIEIIKKFLGVTFAISQLEKSGWLIEIKK